MRMVSKLALAVALGGMTVGGAAFAKKDDKPATPASKTTPAVHKAAYDAQKAEEAGDIPTALTNYNTAKAAIANDDDKFMVGSVGYQIYAKNKDNALLADSLNLMIDSGKAAPATQAKLLFARGQIDYNSRDYAKAATDFQAAQAAGSDDPDVVPLIVESMSLNGQTLAALQVLNAGIAKQMAAGRPVPAEWFQKGISIGYRPKGSPADLPAIHAATLELSKQWVAADPQQRNWSAVLQIYEEQYKLDTEARLDVLRLSRAAGALEGDADYREYADDVYLRFPNEAMQVLQEGNVKGLLNLSAKGDASDVMGIVKGKVAADKASLPAGDKAARTAANGKGALSTADAYVGYGDYAKAVDLYKVALAKGGVDSGIVNLHMGWAQALAGDNAAAKTSFAAVTGPRKPIADFWLVHLDHPTIPNKPKPAA